MKTKKASDPIFDILRKQYEESFIKKPSFYVHYDPKTRKIINFRNYFEKNDKLPHVIMKTEDFGDLDINNIDINKYRVNLKKNNPTLEEIKDLGLEVVRIDDLIYQVPRIVSKKRITARDRSFDLLIEQNNAKKEFRIKLSRELKERYQGSNPSGVMHVYVTAVSDPNILYKTLQFNILDLIKHEYYTLHFDDFQGNESNIYALKYFHEYIHVDIR